MKDHVFQLADIVRTTGFAIHQYHGSGHLEKVYENALRHRLRKQELKVEQQFPMTVFDQDGTVIGEYVADLVVEGILIVEIKAVRSIVDEHVAQLLGYLRSSRIEHGVLLNFVASRFFIKKYVMSRDAHIPETL